MKIQNPLSKPASKNLLIVDDNPDILLTWRLYLEKAGFNVLDAEDGNAALSVLNKSPIDLLITDIVMPDMDGIELLLKVKQDYPTIKIITISGKFDSAIGNDNDISFYLSAAKSFGANLILKKPVKYNELVNCVNTLLKEDENN
jgi:CheY-like chemotaxis protein